MGYRDREKRDKREKSVFIARHKSRGVQLTAR